MARFGRRFPIKGIIIKKQLAGVHYTFNSSDSVTVSDSIVKNLNLHATDSVSVSDSSLKRVLLNSLDSITVDDSRIVNFNFNKEDSVNVSDNSSINVTPINPVQSVSSPGMALDRSRDDRIRKDDEEVILIFKMFMKCQV